MLDLLSECFVFFSWLLPLKRVFTPHALSSAEEALSKGGWGDSQLKKRERNWVELLTQRLLGMLLGLKEKNWPIAARRGPSNDPRNICGMHFGSSSLFVFQWRI